MEMNIGSRLKHAWNAFLNRDPPGSRYYGGGYSYRPDRMRFSRGSERTIINAIDNRIALDAASIMCFLSTSAGTMRTFSMNRVRRCFMSYSKRAVYVMNFGLSPRT